MGDYVVHTKLQSLKEQSLKTRSKEDESRRRMLMMLTGSQGNLLVKTTFSGWAEMAHKSRAQREVEQMRKNMRSKGDESTKRMLGMLMSSQSETLMKAVFSAWWEAAVESHFARMKADLSHMKSKGQEGSKRMLAMLLGSQGELMQKAMFTAWHELIALAKQQREVDRMRAGMKAKGEESTKRMLAMLMGSQEDVVKKAGFAGWHDLVVEVHQQNKVKQMQQDMRAKGAESSKRMLGMLLGSQAETLMKASFASWQETVVGIKMDRIRDAASRMRSKEQESQRRMLTMLMGSQDSLLVKTLFSGWSECIYQLRQMREVEQMKRSMRSKGDESTKRMLGMLLSSQGEALLKAAFAGWHETAVESHIQRMRDDMAHMKSKKEQGTQKMLAMLLGSQAELMQKAMFTGWHELVAVLKKDRETERMKAAMKAKGDESTKRMLAMLMGSQQDVLKKATFAGWRDYVMELRQASDMEELQRVLRAKGEESSKRMLCMLMDSQAEVVVKAGFASWHDYVIGAKMERLREDKLKMRSKEDESRR